MMLELNATCPMTNILGRRQELNYGVVRMESDFPILIIAN
jgi:hypothetical protein